MSRLILLLGIASVLSLFVFGTLLAHWWETNRDNFWIAISIYGFCFVATVMWFSAAKRETSDDDSALVKHFIMVHDSLPGEVEHFTEETAPDWLSSKKTIPGSTYDSRWFWERVLNLDVGQNIKTDFQTITRTK